MQYEPSVGQAAGRQAGRRQPRKRAAVFGQPARHALEAHDCLEGHPHEDVVRLQVLAGHHPAHAGGAGLPDGKAVLQGSQGRAAAAAAGGGS